MGAPSLTDKRLTRNPRLFWGVHTKTGEKQLRGDMADSHPLQHPAGGRTPLRTAFMVIFPSPLMPPAFTDVLPPRQLSVAHLNQLLAEQIH